MAENKGTGEARLFGDLVGSVLSSVVKAQGLAASQLVEMIEKIGFETINGVKTTRTFDFNFVRSELDDKNQPVSKNVLAKVPLLTLINLPSIGITEATIDMDLQLVLHQESTQTGGDGKAPLELFVIPARKQVVRTGDQAMAIDAAGTIKVHVTMRQEAPLGLDKIQSLLGSAVTEEIKLISH